MYQLIISMRDGKMKTIEELKRLNETITNDKIGRSKRPWYGAGIAVVKEQTKQHSEGFYPDPFFVESNKFSLEISWMFEQLRDAFYAEDLLDGWTKEEFFGRLARAANRGIYRNNEDCRIICMEILKEAQQIYGEITSNSFDVLPISSGNTIADDLKEAYFDLFEDISDIVDGNLWYFVSTGFKDYTDHTKPLEPVCEDGDDEYMEDSFSNKSDFPLELKIREVSFDGVEKEYFSKEEIINKKTKQKLSFYICRTKSLYSTKTKNFRKALKDQGLIGVITLKNKLFVTDLNYTVSLVLFGENPTTKFFSSANSFEELYNLIFDKEKYKRSIFYCDGSDVDYDNLLPENYDSRKMSINKFLQDFEPKKLEDIAEIIACPSAHSYEYVENGIPYYTAASIQNGLIVNTDRFIASENAEKFSKALLQEGDILITKFFNQNKIAIVKRENLPGIASSKLFIIRPYEDLDFDLFEYLSTGIGNKIFSKQLDSITARNTVACINKANLKSIPIPTITKDKKNDFEKAYNSNFESVQDLANQILSDLKGVKLEENVYESLKKAGWEDSDISRERRFKYENKFLIPDFTLSSKGKPFAYVEVKSEKSAELAINQLKAIQKENNILAILSLGSLYFEVYKYVDGNYKIYKFISGAPTKQELLNIYKEEK